MGFDVGPPLAACDVCVDLEEGVGAEEDARDAARDAEELAVGVGVGAKLSVSAKLVRASGALER